MFISFILMDFKIKDGKRGYRWIRGFKLIFKLMSQYYYLIINEGIIINEDFSFNIVYSSNF